MRAVALGAWLGVLGAGGVPAAALPSPGPGYEGPLRAGGTEGTPGGALLLVRDGERTEAHLELPAGEGAERAVWLLPLPSRPTLAAGSPTLFRTLEQGTRPRLQLAWSSACNAGWTVLSPGGGDEEPAPPGDAPGEETSYEVDVLEAEEAGALRARLVDAGHAPVSLGAEWLAPLVGRGRFVAVVRPGAPRGEGEARPLVLATEGPLPGLPVRLASTGAQVEAPLRVYVLSDRRALPLHARHVQVNPTRLDWLGGGSNTAQVVREALEEAGGRAFVTEFAGPTQALAARALPSAEAALLGTHPFLTRLVTLPSPGERSASLELADSAQAPPVPHVLEATAREETCEEAWAERRVRVELADGTFFFVTNGRRTLDAGPAGLRVEQLGGAGAPDVLRDDAPRVLAAVQAAGGGVATGCGGCASASAPTGLVALALGLLLLRRRARHR